MGKSKARVREAPRGQYVALTIRVPADLWREIDERADKAGRTLTAEIIRTIKRGVGYDEQG